VAEKPESLMSQFADLVLSPDEARTRLNGIFAGNEELIKLFRTPDRRLDYANFLTERAGKFPDDPDDPSTMELAYSYLRAQYLTITFMEMNWYLNQIEDEKLHEGALMCSRNLWVAAMSDLFTPQTDSTNATRYFLTEQAKSARKKRSERPEQQALQRAIEAELKGRVPLHPYKEAEGILDAVNERLRKEGFKETARKAIGDRLKNSSFFKSEHNKEA
jgi:hypothetical protein